MQLCQTQVSADRCSLGIGLSSSARPSFFKAGAVCMVDLVLTADSMITQARTSRTMSLCQLTSASMATMASSVLALSLKLLKLDSLGGLLPKLNLWQNISAMHRLSCVPSRSKEGVLGSAAIPYFVNSMLCIHGGDDACNKSGRSSHASLVNALRSSGFQRWAASGQRLLLAAQRDSKQRV